MAKIAVIEMFDSVDSDIPTHATAKAGYVAGNFPTWNEQWFKDIQAKYALSIAVQADEDAMMLDVEAGDATDEQAPGWLERRKAAGEKGDFYRQASAVMGLIHTLDAAGHKFGVDYYVVTAHYTGVPHICGPQCGFGIDRQMHGTQWTDHALGRNLDESLVSVEIFNLSRHPEYAILDTELRKLKGTSLKRVSERGRIMTYDRLQPGGERALVASDCLILFNRLWDVVHEHGKLPAGSPKAQKNWTVENRGERGRILWEAAHGRR
jgi:hypothetical protein